MSEESRKRIAKIAEEVAAVLAANNVTYFEVSYIFHAAERYLVISHSKHEDPRRDR